MRRIMCRMRDWHIASVKAQKFKALGGFPYGTEEGGQD